MAKRFIDTDIWSKKWFMALSPEYKCAFMYMFTNCDCIGLWDPNELLASFQIGNAEIDWNYFYNLISKQIEILPNGKIFLKNFCHFQYGKLKETCKPHKRYIHELKKHNLYERVSKGYPEGIDTLQEEDIEKEKKENKENPKGYQKSIDTLQKEINNPEKNRGPKPAPSRKRSTSFPCSVEKIIAAYPRQSHHVESIRAAASVIDLLFDSGKFVNYETVEAYLLDRVEQYAAAVKQWAPAEKQFLPKCSTWMEAGQYNDDPNTWKRTPKQGQSNATEKTSNNFKNSRVHYNSMPQRPPGDF